MIAPQYREVVPEDSLEVEGQQKAPDYTLRVGTLPKFYVEAKRCGANIGVDSAPAFQIRRYGWSAKLAVSILTDFEELSVYDCSARPRASDKATYARILHLTCSEYVERWQELWDLFSREAVWSGAFDQFAASKRKRDTSEVDVEFLKEMESWRLALAGNIALRNKELSQDDLNAAVQLIIDRVVFLRMAEDRGLESYEQLLKLCEGINIYSRFIRDVCRKADQKYNSGLFHFQRESGAGEEPDRLTPKLIVDDKVFKPILQKLYFAYGSPYHFGILPIEILGTAYERFLGKVIRLTAGHQAKVEEKPEVRKAGGVYYTPSYIVDYIVERTVAQQIKGRSPAQLAGGKEGTVFRILDMACGSGSFLIGAYQCLLDYCLDWYINHKPETFKRAVFRDPQRNQWRLKIEEKKRILTTHIFGVDIDRQAVEVTKLSLLLKVLEGETDQSLSLSELPFGDRALPNLADNIKRGNSLISSDFSIVPTDIIAAHAFNWSIAFSAAMRDGGFDVVIDNPPYVRIQGFPRDQSDYLAAHYEVATGNFDLYVSFIERGWKLLKSSGTMGQIVPNKFMKTDYGRGLRKLISSNKALTEVVDFRANQVFQSTTYVCLLFLDKQKPETFLYARAEAKRESLLQLSRSVQDSSQLTEEIWSISDAGTSNLLARLRDGSVRLLDLPAEMSRGSSTGDDEVFVVSADQSRLERALLRLPIFATDFGRYRFSPSGKWQVIFPYFIEDSSVRPFTEQELKAFPKAFAYLNDYRSKLKQRRQNTVWYGFSAPRSLALHERAQIIVPLLADRGLCTLIPPDTNGTLCPMAGAGFTITLGTKCFLRPEYILGLINSKLLFWWLQQKSNIFRGEWITCTKQYFGELPIRKLDLSQVEERARHDKLANLVIKIIGLTSKLNSATTEADREALQSAITATDSEIDLFVYDLYGLTDSQIATVEASTGAGVH